MDSIQIADTTVYIPAGTTEVPSRSFDFVWRRSSGGGFVLRLKDPEVEDEDDEDEDVYMRAETWLSFFATEDAEGRVVYNGHPGRASWWYEDVAPPAWDNSDSD